MIENSWPFAEKLILDIVEATAQLRQQLAQEAELLKTGPQAELIDASAAQKKRLANQLEGLNSQLGRLLAAEQVTTNQEGVALYLQRAEAAGLPTAQTLANWRQFRRLCAECQALNEQNGASIELLSLHAKRSLDILKGKTHATNTYGRNGTAQSESLNHTLAFYL
jgi:flagella synthesis protein FlgN